MDFSLAQIAYWVILPLISGLVLLVIKDLIFKRIDNLEEKITHTVTELDVRTLLSDKLDPIQEDVKEIKADIKSLFSMKAEVSILQSLGLLNERRERE